VFQKSLYFLPIPRFLLIFLWLKSVCRGIQIHYQQEAILRASIILPNLCKHSVQNTSIIFYPGTSILERRINRGIGARSLPVPIGEQWPIGRETRGRLSKQNI
jgi:hypothetical protein